MDAEAPDDAATLGLLAGGVSLAQAAKALPDDAEGRRWRAAVPALVGLHLLVGRLGEAAAGEPEPLTRPRALALLAEHRRAIGRAFGDDVPAEVAALVDEAAAAVDRR